MTFKKRRFIVFYKNEQEIKKDEIKSITLVSARMKYKKKYPKRTIEKIERFGLGFNTPLKDKNNPRIESLVFRFLELSKSTKLDPTEYDVIVKQ